MEAVHLRKFTGSFEVLKQWKKNKNNSLDSVSRGGAKNGYGGGIGHTKGTVVYCHLHRAPGLLVASRSNACHSWPWNDQTLK